MPAIVEVSSGKVVTNDFAQLTLDFATEWTDFHRPGAPDLYPVALREEMDQVMRRVYTEVNNGVYRCGFAGSQEAYDAAYDRLFAALDWLEERLADRRFELVQHLAGGRRRRSELTRGGVQRALFVDRQHQQYLAHAEAVEQQRRGGIGHGRSMKFWNR